MIKTISISLKWSPRKWWSRYERGKLLSLMPHREVKQILRKPTTGEIRVHSHERGWPLHGTAVIVNGETAIKVYKRGRFGRLHISG